MCGIVGLASREAPGTRPPLDRMRDCLRHRGPDDAGTWWSEDSRVGLAMRRLAIIDLSPGGHQPMTDHTGRFWITYNGEIYNYRLLRAELQQEGHQFRTESDTEVILEAYKEWGTDCPARLNGMFAFALYDVEGRSLFLARDRAGEKPLFYRDDGRRLDFASELKALLEDESFPRELDRTALQHYLAYGYVSAPLCLLRGVRKLPPAHAMTWDLETGSSRIWRYWCLPVPFAESARNAEGLVDELETLLLDSVRLRLIADVPIGILLSGGIDSSLVTAMAARASSKTVRTFTITFPGDESYDEAPFAREVANYFGTRHTELAAEAASVDLLPELARQFDEPIADSSMVPTYLVSRLIREHATVALGGDGGDELFGGYLHYDWVQRQARAEQRLPRPARRAVSAMARHLPLGVRGRGYLIAFDEDAAKCIAYSNLFFDESGRHHLLRSLGEQNGESPERLRMALARTGGTPLQQATTVDFLTYLPDDILVKVDRASMLASLEVRAPWLDPRIIELAFGRLPEKLRAVGSERKILPRRLAKRLLPASLDLRRKRGFSIPIDRWFRGDWGNLLREVLFSRDSLFDQRVIQSLFQGQRWHLRNTHRLFALAMFELWRRHYRVRV